MILFSTLIILFIYFGILFLFLVYHIKKENRETEIAHTFKVGDRVNIIGYEGSGIIISILNERVDVYCDKVVGNINGSRINFSRFAVQHE